MAPRTILHADLDAFYASVEQLDDPSLRGKPVIVGGRPGDRGVVSAASYEARAFGVHLGDAAAHGRPAAAPTASSCPADRTDTARRATQVMAIFASFTPLVEPISLDEAFLDVTASTAAFGDGPTIGRTIKQRVLDEVGLVVSVGVATNKLCAKVASDLRKPDALVVVPPGEEAAFLAPLPIRRLWGVGPQAQAALADYGVVTIGQLAATPPGTLHRRFGRFGDDLSARARGIDRGRVQVDPRRRRASATSTPSIPTRPTSAVSRPPCSTWPNRSPAACAGTTWRRDRSSSSFATRASRRSPARRRCPDQTREARALYDAALALLRRTLVAGRGVRLIGLTAINLTRRAAADPVRRARTAPTA